MEDRQKTQWYIGAPNGVVLCVDRACGRDLSGVLWHSYSTAPEPFENIEQMTRRMERLYDWLRFPFPGNSDRTFGDEKRPEIVTEERKKIMSDEKLLQKHGDLGSFIVRVQHRQNSSWQGRITWMEEDRTINFRSVWEMIKLIESAVNTVGGPESEEEADWFSEES